MKIVFKRQPQYPQIEREYAQLDKRLYPIIQSMQEIAWGLWLDLLVCTRIYENDGSTHAGPKPYRFIDFALLESGIENTEALRGMINQRHPYGVAGFSTIPPLDHSAGNPKHLHVQVKPNSSIKAGNAQEGEK